MCNDVLDAEVISVERDQDNWRIQLIELTNLTLLFWSGI